MKFDFDKFKKPLLIGGAIILVLIIIIAVASGKKTVKEDIRVVTLPAEEQILQDTYRLSKKITNELTYTPYFVHQGQKIIIIDAFDPFLIQLDCMNLFTIGRSTMGDVVKAVDTANKITLDTIVEEVRAERQQKIDDAYNAAKKEAEEKGKAFNKEKATADISDLNYVNPYSYKVNIGKINTSSSSKKDTTQDYEASYLVDPAKSSVIYLIVYKYSIPYVQFEFMKINNMVNYNIRQECDWTLTGVAAADCSSLVNSKTGARPAYVGDDKRCIAKSNIVMSGNINFAGDGFAWDNTEIIMKALGLVDATSANKASTYVWKSDDQYAYYTITVPTKLFFDPNEEEENGKYYYPMTTMVATFDRHTQKCLNWEISIAKKYGTFNKKDELEIGAPVTVDIKNYQVDTKDYQKMQDKVDSWALDNQTVFDDSGYYLINCDNNNSVVGKLDNGIFNLFAEEVSVEGTVYVCLENYKGGTGLYIKNDDLLKAPRGVSDAEYQEYINSHAFVGEAEYLFLKKNKKTSTVLAALGDDLEVITMDDSDVHYYVYTYKYDDNRGYSDIVIIDQLVYEKLGDMYIMSYRLEEDEQDELFDAGRQKYALGMKEYIQKLHPGVE